MQRDISQFTTWVTPAVIIVWFTSFFMMWIILSYKALEVTITMRCCPWQGIAVVHGLAATPNSARLYK